MTSIGNTQDAAYWKATAEGWHAKYLAALDERDQARAERNQLQQDDQPIWAGPDLVAEAGLTHVDEATRVRAFEAFDAAKPGLVTRSSLIRRLLVRLDDVRNERDRLRGELERLRALHHTPYVDESHQGGNCVDMFMEQTSEIVRLRGELAKAKDRPTGIVTFSDPISKELAERFAEVFGEIRREVRDQ